MKFDLSNPIKKITLPFSLIEVSGLTFYKDSKLLCHHDESEDVYIVDYKGGSASVIAQSKKQGDIEGIEYVGQHLYLLRSDGRIIEHQFFSTEQQQSNRYKTRLNESNNTEGLGYDPVSNSLLIACKDKASLKKSKDKLKDKRCIYRFNLDKMQLVEQPYICIDLEQLKKKDKIYSFKPSAIASHPVDKTIYILSNTGKALLIIDHDLNIVHTEKLDKKLFSQPEGICFSPDGQTLFISNEGKGNKGNILVFEQ